MIVLTIDVINLPNQIIDIDETPLQEVEIKQDSVINVNPAPFYEGEYDVTPKVTEQTLATAHKLLEKDVHIKKIPYFKVSNTSGGNTVFIGREV